MSVGFVYDPLCLEHDTGDHPERPQRLLATMALLDDAGLPARLRRIAARDATPDELALVHDPRYIDALRRLACDGGGWVDPDTLVTPRSFDAAARAAGAALAAVDAVLRGDVASAFCLVRPPGHHASPAQAMGFCLLNHVAVAAAYARRAHGLARVAVVDFDVHHGNGTQDAFYADPDILYVSTHEYPFYPGTGRATETGVGAGRRANINIPLPHGAGDAAHLLAFEAVVLPALRRFGPDLILVSAGYDAHFADEIAGQRLSVDGYGALVSLLCAAAAELCGGRLVFTLEGGYDLVALPWCVRRTLELLLGVAPAPDPLGAPPADTREPDVAPLLREVRALHGL